MTTSKIEQQVANLLERVNSGKMTVQQLENAFANAENNNQVSEEQREDLIEAISLQMRMRYPSVAKKRFGPVNRESRQKLEAYLDSLKFRFDLSENGHKTKVKVGGDVIKGETLVNDYISYRNQDTRVACHLFFSQHNHEAPREWRVVMKAIAGQAENRVASAFPESAFDEACELFENYLEKVLKGDLPN